MVCPFCGTEKRDESGFCGACGRRVSLTEPQRLINTFIAPTKTFTDIRRKASWWAPFLVVAVAWVALAFTAGHYVGWNQILENRMRMAPRQAEQLDKLPPAQKAQQMRIQLIVTKGIGYGFPVFILIGILVIAGILLATMNFGAGAEAKFGQVMAVVTYAHLPLVIKSILGIVTLAAGASPEGFTLENPIASNLSGLFTVGTPMYALGAALDGITIWELVLTGIGLACITKLKRGTTFAMVFGWWALVTMIGVGIAALFA